METSLDVVEGMQFDRGYLSPYFVTDPERMEVVLEDPHILIHEKKISSLMKDLLPVLEKVAQSGPAAADHRRGGRGRGAGHARRQQAARHAAASPRSRRRASAIGARRCSRTSRSSPAARPSPRTSGSSSRTCAIERSGLGEEGHDRQGQHDDHRRRRLEGHRGPRQAAAGPDRGHHLRLRPGEAAGAAGEARGRRAVIKVGAATETEMKEKKAASRTPCTRRRPPSRRASSRAAAWRCCARRRARQPGRDVDDDDERLGVEIIRRAAEAAALDRPERGLEGSIVAAKVCSRRKKESFNAQTEGYENLIKAGAHRPGRSRRSPSR